MKVYSLSTALLILLRLFYAHPAEAQETELPADWKAQVLHHDSLFWQAYNLCDTETMARYFTEDMEFYHDNNGLTSGLQVFKHEMETGLCGQEDWHLRREELKGSLELFPVAGYGAILTGEHIFFIQEKGGEYLDGHARFTHVWRYGNNGWKMARVLSFGHQPAKQTLIKNEIVLPDQVLNSYAGTYEGPNTGKVIITKKQQLLEIHAGKMQALMHPESESLFYHDEQPLTFEFISNTDGQVEKLIVRERGNIVEEARRIH